MTEDFARLDDSQFNELLRIGTFYYCEARKCNDVRAWAAGCVMLGAALEADLMAMSAIYRNDVAACDKLPGRKRGSVKPLLKWNLGELLDVAKELDWLPVDESLGSDPKDWLIGTHAQVIRILRNLIHPGRYLKDFPGYRITEDELTASFKVLDGVHMHLSAALNPSHPRNIDRGQAQ